MLKCNTYLIRGLLAAMLMCGMSFQAQAVKPNLKELIFEGNKHFYGENTSKNVKKAMEYYQQAADAGSTEAMNKLGHIYLAGKHRGGKPEFVFARSWFEKAVTEKDPEGMVNLGKMYEMGQGVTRDYGKAMAYYKQAGDHVAAMVAMGYLYENGFGTIASFKEAETWYQKAVNKESAQGMTSLGRLYEKNGMFDKAHTMLMRAADLKDVKALITLSGMYDLGSGVSSDKVISLALLQVATAYDKEVDYTKEIAAQTRATQKKMSEADRQIAKRLGDRILREKKVSNIVRTYDETAAVPR